MFLKIIKVIAIVILVLMLAIYLFLKFYPSIGDTPTKEMQENYAIRSDNIEDGVFYNIESYETNFLSAVSSKSGERKTPSGTIPVVKNSVIEKLDEDEFAFTWLGHSSLLLQLSGKNILIDPMLSKNASPVPIAVERFSDAPINVEDMPNIDILLISHDHYDHLDYNTIIDIDHKVDKYVVSLGIESILLGWDIDPDKIVNLAWWEEYGDDVQIALTPSRHFSGRSLFDRSTTLWGGFYLKNDDFSVYYTGDGGYTEIFKEVREKYGDVDVCFAETGQYNNAWPNTHMFPKQSIQAAWDVNAKYVVPVHWGAFALSNHNWDDPVIKISEESKQGSAVLITPKIGEVVNYNSIEMFQDKWWEEV